ncbi:hypothetical protein DPMN_020960 [Dreissena polymorpha]|uniref:Uncharacterized protein n=1 Tax=Dreissena polymorpha TaxID=45954 RepID=A0A9D4NNF4_DREPO|nr:hypothetical protein DPMN_020960 [Dreissena polymorpha]
MSHYNLSSRLSATLSPQLMPPASPPDDNHKTVLEQPSQPPTTTIPKQETPKPTSTSESKHYLQTPEDFVASKKRLKKRLRSDFHK